MNPNRAFQEAITQTSRTLLLYSDVVNSNIVGEPTKRCGHDVFRTPRLQWLLLRRPYLDVIEVSLAESNGCLVAFGKGKTFVTFQFRRRGANL